MSKIKITRTFGPIHFEDLDPHRFEDLIRELIYDYKEWQSIEATGRSGSDAGFDIRAYEKNNKVISTENDNNEEIIEFHPMEGNLWMIQGKREKEISPEKIKKILKDIDSNNPPYGYILAASANFSKKSFDTFRGILYEKGVMEFYLWGKAELEDMLHLPKNDRILFTFFGISLISMKRVKTTEIRAAINIKNKLTRAIEKSGTILIRDLNDDSYPKINEINRLYQNNSWYDYEVISHHPLGLIIHIQEYFAYVDFENKSWDYTDELDLIYHQRENDNDELSELYYEKQKLIKEFYDFLPRKFKCKMSIYGLLKYSDIELVDDKGDILYDSPHIYVNYVNNSIPFFKQFKCFKLGFKEILLTDEYKRVPIFPEKFTKYKNENVYRDKRIIFNELSLRLFQDLKIDTICCDSDTYEFLNPRDIILVETNKSQMEETYIQITYKTHELVKDYYRLTIDQYQLKISIETQLSRVPDDMESLYFYEFNRIYLNDFQ
ncbi:MAG: hypothetical protein CVV22_09645 [Ignavibacteriae bacterium HGW-Ignavibacteriae-1]|jgi:hypothetical protein|nr:MAG: hypothetical protein CVV22_09645 [Ignavibacteriae bacterium HGW-Ignavibacteriae-1]